MSTDKHTLAQSIDEKQKKWHLSNCIFYYHIVWPPIINIWFDQSYLYRRDEVKLEIRYDTAHDQKRYVCIYISPFNNSLHCFITECIIIFLNRLLQKKIYINIVIDQNYTLNKVGSYNPYWLTVEIPSIFADTWWHRIR